MIQKKITGTHVLANMFGISSELIAKKASIKRILNHAVKATKLTKVGETYYQFKPEGVTAVILLAESHISIHTWPEKNYAALDIFTCGPKTGATDAYKVLKELLKPTKVVKKIVKR